MGSFLGEATLPFSFLPPFSDVVLRFAACEILKFADISFRTITENEGEISRAGVAEMVISVLKYIQEAHILHGP